MIELQPYRGTIQVIKETPYRLVKSPAYALLLAYLVFNFFIAGVLLSCANY